MPAELTELKIGRVTVKLRRAGNGPKVLFLHGAGGVPQWMPFFEVQGSVTSWWCPSIPVLVGSAVFNRAMPRTAIGYPPARGPDPAGRLTWAGAAAGSR